MAGHHLILGKLRDFITGNTLDDTHDERYKQLIARLLVEKKGYAKTDIIPRIELLIRAGEHSAIVKVDFKITLSGKACMVIKYGPGSLVSRQRPALAASRLVEPYQIPVAVITNGEEGDIMDGETGKVISSGLDAILSKSELLERVQSARFQPVSAKRAEMESRIVYAFEVDGSCPCDDTLCRLE